MYNVELIEDGEVTETNSFESYGDAEIFFLNQCSDKIWNFNEYDASDIDDILEDGEVSWGNSTLIIY